MGRNWEKREGRETDQARKTWLKRHNKKNILGNFLPLRLKRKRNRKERKEIKLYFKKLVVINHTLYSCPIVDWRLRSWSEAHSPSQYLSRRIHDHATNCSKSPSLTRKSLILLSWGPVFRWLSPQTLNNRSTKQNDKPSSIYSCPKVFFSSQIHANHFLEAPTKCSF